ncbi:hypothetical protein [Lysinibacillus sphaericus]|nr:hypothetical protein [Lysinibacillus sphaericus]
MLVTWRDEKDTIYTDTLMLRTSTRMKMPLGFWEGLRQLGVAPHDVIRKAQLPIALMTEPTVSLAQYYGIW